MLLIENSFFRPYAQKFDAIAIDAGYVNYNSTIVIRGGKNGSAINFWNDENSTERNLIKSISDQETVDFSG